MPRSDAKDMSRDELREISVLVGSGGASQEFTEQQYRYYYEGKQKQCSVYVIPTSTPGTLASEVSMRFGFRGFSHLISTGCTSSTDAIRIRDADDPIRPCEQDRRGGVGCAYCAVDRARFSIHADHVDAMEQSPRNARRGRSRGIATDSSLRRAPGFLFRKRRAAPWSAARRIYGEICGYGSTCEAYHRVRLEECGEEPARAIDWRSKEAGVAAGTRSITSIITALQRN